LNNLSLVAIFECEDELEVQVTSNWVCGYWILCGWFVANIRWNATGM